MKFSSAYVPPELIYVEPNVVCVRSPMNKRVILGVDYVEVFSTDELLVFTDDENMTNENRSKGVVGNSNLDMDVSNASTSNTTTSERLDDRIMGARETVELNFDYVRANPAHDMWSIGVFSVSFCSKMFTFQL